MWGMNNMVKCGMVVLAFASITTGFASNPGSFDSFDGRGLKNDSLVPKKGAVKNEVAKPDESTIVTPNSGVTITTSGSYSMETLKDDEVFIEKTHVKREIVLEEDFKLWRTYVQKGRKTTEYRKVETSYGTYFKKNQMDITEEGYLHETKDLPNGEIIRYKRDEYEAKERERIEEEIRKHFEIKTIPLDSLNQVPAPTLDTLQQGK